jgi:hypothetical protein
VRVSKGLVEEMLNLSVRLSFFTFRFKFDDETLSFADVIHSDAGGLGKPEAIGDAGQTCPFTLIELVI